MAVASSLLSKGVKLLAGTRELRSMEECEDYNSKCGEWLAKGHCQANLNSYSFMKMNCAR